jgi:hypothetical protein
MSAITITQEQLETLTREILRQFVAGERELIVAEIRKAFAVVDEKTAMAMLPIGGKEPLRTFRRLMNKYGVPKVQLGGVTGYRVTAIQKLIDDHSVSSKPKPRVLKMVATATSSLREEGSRAA